MSESDTNTEYVQNDGRFTDDRFYNDDRFETFDADYHKAEWENRDR
jgi:hypothetical protein